MDHESPISRVPPELLYDILAEVYSAYIDFAITVPPPHELRRIQRQQAQLSQLDDLTGENTAVENIQTNAVGAAPEDEDDLLDVPELSASMLATWEAREAADPLPESQITPLLSVSRYIREIAMKVLHDALGYRCGEESNSMNPNSILKALRRLYRTVQSGRFPLLLVEEIIEIWGKLSNISPLMLAYLNLSFTTYSQHHLAIKFNGAEAQVGSKPAFENGHALAYMLLYATVVSQPWLQRRILQRAQNFMNEISNFELMTRKISTILVNVQNILDNQSVESLVKDKGVIHKLSVPMAALNELEQDFKTLDKGPFPAFPRYWCQVIQRVPHVLTMILNLPVAELGWNKDPISLETLRIARTLRSDWKRRSLVSAYTVLP